MRPRPWRGFRSRNSSSPRACGSRSRARGRSVASRREARHTSMRTALRSTRSSTLPTFRTSTSMRRPRTWSAPSSRRRRRVPGTRTSTGTPMRTRTPIPAPPPLRAVRRTSAGRSPDAEPRAADARIPNAPTPPAAITTRRRPTTSSGVPADERTTRGAPRRSSASPTVRIVSETAPRVWFAMWSEVAAPAAIVVRAGQTTSPARRGAPAEAGATTPSRNASDSSRRTVSAGPPCTSRLRCTAPRARWATAS